MFVCFYVWFVILGSGFCRVSSVSLTRWRNWVWNGYPFDLKDQRRIPRLDDLVLLMASWWWIWVCWRRIWCCWWRIWCCWLAGCCWWWILGLFVFFFLPLYFGFVCVLSLFAFWDFAQTVLGFILFYLFIIFYADLYIFLDLWVWFPRGFNIDCVGIFCAEIDFEWVSQLGLSWDRKSVV